MPLCSTYLWGTGLQYPGNDVRNAISSGAKQTVSLEGKTIFCTVHPNLFTENMPLHFG